LKSFGNTSSNSKHLIKYSKDGAAVRAIHPRPERRGFSRNPVNLMKRTLTMKKYPLAPERSHLLI